MDLGASRRHIPPMQFTVTVSHDEQEGVWFVESSNVPGLNAEAPSFDALVEVISEVAPELIAANVPEAAHAGAGSIPVCVQHVVNMRRAHAA